MARDTFKFAKDGKFLADKVGAEIAVEAPKDSELARCLLQNRPFPPGPVQLSKLSADVSGGMRNIRFGDALGTVTFKGGGGARAGFGAYDKASDLVRDLDTGAKTLSGIQLPSRGVARFVSLYWGYDVAAALKGSVALGHGAAVKFGAEGEREGFFAVIRAFEDEPRSQDALAAAVSSWKLPRQVATIEDLQPGTWLISEVDGEFALSLGARFGFDYNWIRRVGAGALSGDIGLRIQAAAEATIGFSSSGKYLLVLARESIRPESRSVRLRLFKTTRKGWNFALNSTVRARGDTGKFLPGELDDFVSAVFGVHGAQLVEDLKRFREWTDPATPLPDHLAGFVSSYATRRLSGLLPPGVERLEAARKRIGAFLADWDKLDSRIAGLLWSEFRKGSEAVGIFEDVLRALADSGSAALKKRIADSLSDVAFFNSPAGRLLEAAATGPVLTALTSAEALSGIRETARKILAVLDGEVLEELFTFAGEKLRIEQVRKIVDAAQMESLDAWLKKKLSDFLGRTVDFASLEEIRKTLHFLDQKSGELYGAAVKALNKKYAASLHYAYASATEKTALIDVTFDFNEDPGLGPFLASAINGNLTDLLVRGRKGISLAQAELTHATRRQSHLEIHLPYSKQRIEKINESLAKMSLVEDGGRLFVYNLQAEDRLRTGQKWQSSLAVTGKLTVVPGSEVRTFVTDEQIADSMTFSYSFRQALPGLRALQLEERIEPLVAPYFPRAFGGAQAPEKASVSEWVRDLDKLADQVQNNGSGNLGNTLLSLEVSLPGATVAAWHKAPSEDAENQKPYLDMSRAIQTSLRRLIPYCYFSDAERYAKAEFPIAANVLVYQCLPISTSVRLRDRELTMNTDEDVYWEYNDVRADEQNVRFAMIYNQITAAGLGAAMARVRRLLEDIPSLRKWADDYAPSNIDALRSHAWRATGRHLLANSLLFSESTAIRQAREAGYAIARFRDAAAADPEEALAALAEFGSRITQTFHRGLNSLFGSQTLRDLGSLVFLEAARALDPSLAAATPAARLEVIILRESAPSSWASDFMEGKQPDSSVVAVRQPIVGV